LGRGARNKGAELPIGLFFLLPLRLPEEKRESNRAFRAFFPRLLTTLSNSGKRGGISQPFCCGTREPNVSKGRGSFRKFMNVDNLRRQYAQIPPKRVYPKVKDPNIQEGTIPAEYILSFGKFKGEQLSKVPTHYLQWIVSNVTSRPDVVELIKRYLNQPVPEKRIANLSGLKPRVEKQSPLVQRLRGQPPISAEEGDLSLRPYSTPIFGHPMMNSTYEGVPLREISILELERILEKYPSPQFRDFVAHRCCHLYAFFVYDRYEQAAKLDFSVLTAAEASQYEAVMNVCREIQTVLDSVQDVKLCKAILQSSHFVGMFSVSLPMAR
jgi:hypothetical protein